MKVYVVEECHDEGGRVLGVALNIDSASALVAKELEDMEIGTDDIKMDMETFDNIIKFYVWHETDQPAFAIREFVVEK